MPLDRFLTLRVVQPWRRRAAPPSCARPILMYHRIAEDAEPGVSSRRRLCTPPARFREQLQWLAAAGWRGVSVSEALAAAPGSGPHCAITFDDGFQDFATQAAPALAAHGFGATVYLPAAFIADVRRDFQQHPCLTWTEVRDLRAAGFEFGSHTLNHPRLHGLPWPDIWCELGDSKARIASELGCSVTGFSYPFAFPQADRPFARAFAGVLRALGYRHGVTTAIGCSRFHDDPLLLRRVPVSGADDRRLFLAKVSGDYDWVARPQTWAKAARFAFTGAA